MTPILTVAICTRDDLHRLSLCLEGIALQATAEMDVVVVNDGGPPVDDLVAGFGNRLLIRSTRLDPPSDAYRLAAARNWALRFARGDRVLFLDQDCVAAAGVLAAHAAYGATLTAVAGVRYHLPEAEVAALTAADVPGLARRILRPDFRLRVDRFLSISGRAVRMVPRCLTGCHVSVPTAQMRDIGGYWEEFVGWGHEDIEMAMRLGRAGCSMTARADLVVVHLDHPPRLNPEDARRNSGLLAKTERDRTVVRRGPPLEAIP